jgi:hypothetical protein
MVAPVQRTQSLSKESWYVVSMMLDVWEGHIMVYPSCAHGQRSRRVHFPGNPWPGLIMLQLAWGWQLAVFPKLSKDLHSQHEISVEKVIRLDLPVCKLFPVSLPQVASKREDARWNVPQRTQGNGWRQHPESKVFALTNWFTGTSSISHFSRTSQSYLPVTFSWFTRSVINQQSLIQATENCLKRPGKLIRATF